MKMIDINELINKYIDGTTSNDEEKILKEYFANAGHIIPEDLAAYKALFAFETKEALLQDRKSTMKPEIYDDKKPTGTAEIRHLYLIHHIWKYVSGAVACAIVISVFALLSPQGHQSYAVINGKKYTDPVIVKQQAEKALDIVSTDDEETFAALTQ